MSAPGFQGNKYLVDIPADSAAFVAILAKSPLRRLVIQESQITAEGAANPPQGIIQYRLPNDGTSAGFTTVFVAVQGVTLPIQLPDQVNNFPSTGPLLGNGPTGSSSVGVFPGSNNVPSLVNGAPATHLIDLRSGTGTGTTVEITEYN